MANNTPRYMTIEQYAQHSGIAAKTVRQLCRCYLAEEFAFRVGSSRNAKYMINAERLNKMIDSGELREVLA